MLSSTRNYDVICFQMKQHLSHLNPDMKTEVDKFVSEIKLLLTSNTLKLSIDAFLPTVFNFRVKALIWLFVETEFEFENIFKKTYNEIQSLGSKYEVLKENILFALRCNNRVIGSLIESGELSSKDFANKKEQLKAITYLDFLTSLTFSIPNDELCQKVIDWVNASLYIELIIIATSIINDEQINIPESKIKELAYLIANAAQEYYAFSVELGILKQSTTSSIAIGAYLNNEFISEQQYLSELDIDPFANNF